MSRAKAICRIVRNGKVEWVHYSKQDETVKLRWFYPSYDEKNLSDAPNAAELRDCLSAGKEFSLSKIAALTEDVVDFSADRLPVGNKDEWRQIIERLLELPPEDFEPPPGPAQRPPAAPPATSAASLAERQGLIPQTRLRRFYQMLRLFSAAALQEQVADFFVAEERSDRLQVVFAESWRHFSRYQNVEEHFHRRLETNSWDWFEGAKNSPSDFAHCLVARLNPANGKAFHDIDGIPDSRIQAVDYDISTFRSTQDAGFIAFEDGKQASRSGSGGLDLVLHDRGVPVVGEIKAPGDATLFLALIQALTYAVEITTEAQTRRLKKHYEREFTNLPVDDSGCKCDIFLFYEKDDVPKLLKQTEALSEQLLSNKDSAIARRVRRIAAIGTELTSDVGIRFKCTFCVTAART